MRQDNARAAVGGGIGDYVTKRQSGPADVAVMAGEVNAPRLFVDMRNPQMFLVRSGLGEATGKEAPGGVEAVQLQREFGTLMEHATALVQARARSDANRIQRGQVVEPKWTHDGP